MARKTLGFEELQWTCPNCGGLNPGSIQTCSSCGAPQPEDVKFEQAGRGQLLEDEEAIARAKAGPDIHCPYCGTRNPGDAEVCQQCGGDLIGGEQRQSGAVLGAFKTGPAGKITCPSCGAENPDTARTCTGCGSSLRQQKEPVPVAAPPASQTQRKQRPVWVAALTVVVLCSLAGALVYFLFFRSEDVSATVSGVGWEREIEIEGLVPVEHSDWADQIPSEGEVLECQQEVRSIESEPQANAEEVCGTPYSVDTGGGYAEVVQDCEYHVYDAFCSYTMVEWSVVDTISLSGNDFNPDWPDPSLGADERLGLQTESYQVFFDADSDSYTYSTSSFNDFQDFAIGSRWNLEVNTLGGVKSVKP